MRNIRDSRINHERQREDADIADVCGSETTDSEVANAIEAGWGLDPEAGDDAIRSDDDAEPEPDPEPDIKRRKIDETTELLSDAQASSYGSLPPLINVATAVPCAAANPFSQVSPPLYQHVADGEGNLAEGDGNGNDGIFDHDVEEGKRRDNRGSPFR